MGLRGRFLVQSSVALISLILVLGLVSSVFATSATATASATQQNTIVQVFSTEDNTIHKLDLKVTEDSSGQISHVSNFVIEPESVVAVEHEDDIIVFTNEQIHKVKITNMEGELITLERISDNVFSTEDIDEGVYLLHIIIRISSELYAYETVLVILEEDEELLQPVQYITKVKTEINTRTDIDNDIKIIFKEDNDKDRDRDKDRDKDKCSDKEGSANMGFPMEKRTECEKRDFDRCEKIGLTSSDFCDYIHELFHDNDCLGFANQEECDEAYGVGNEEPEPIDCPQVVSYGQGPCDEYYIPPDEEGKCPEDHKFVSEAQGCVPQYSSLPVEPSEPEPIPIEEPEPEPEPEPKPPTDLCGCPIGEDCPDVVCDEPIGIVDEEDESKEEDNNESKDNDSNNGDTKKEDNEEENGEEEEEEEDDNEDSEEEQEEDDGEGEEG